MKLFYLASIAFFAAFGTAKATEYIVLAEGTTIPTDIFTPNITYAQVGDTITWIWVDGIHTTESITIPEGAASWASNLNSSTTTFSYVVTVPGSYYYDCHASFSHGMDGYIEVSAAPTGINDIENALVSEIYPNPFTDYLTVKGLEFDRVEVYNIIGSLLRTYSNNSQRSSVEMDLSDLRSGIYFVAVSKDGKQVESRKVVKQ
ncbi:MAG: T9SS type A sorting domain-containing protein [Flavobacteriales bacterium]|nr:T9SS type A sorting domain-containing protein [Flavobacteriales bacterium]